MSTAISPIGTFTGSLKFSYNAGQIQTEGEHDFTIKLDTYRSIATPENIDDKQYLNQTGCATFTFYRFEYNNLPDLSKLTVSSTFEQAGTTFTYKVINATYSTFDLALSVKDATPAQLSGRLIFSYDGVQITEAPDVEFSINMLHAAEIYIPDDVKDRSIDLLVNPDAISVATFRNFRYSNILDPENIEIRGG
ncbi:MAG: hypothetical protein MJ233_00300 [Mycoplasmoidaceae bacterium]|nr:hypothetical protein [Mycoplasmoidaceae bacterium]